jgi:hypothetical protein
MLDLGRVGSVADVFVNGACRHPGVEAVSTGYLGLIRPGANEIKILVTNTESKAARSGDLASHFGCDRHLRNGRASTTEEQGWKAKVLRLLEKEKRTIEATGYQSEYGCLDMEKHRPIV